MNDEFGFSIVNFLWPDAIYYCSFYDSVAKPAEISRFGLRFSISNALTKIVKILILLRCWHEKKTGLKCFNKSSLGNTFSDKT